MNRNKENEMRYKRWILKAKVEGKLKKEEWKWINEESEWGMSFKTKKVKEEEDPEK